MTMFAEAVNVNDLAGATLFRRYSYYYRTYLNPGYPIFRLRPDGQSDPPPFANSANYLSPLRRMLASDLP